MKKLFIIVVCNAVLSGCMMTAFSGDAKVPNGPAGCEIICGEWGMELIGMIALGEYTDGCICKKKGVKEVSMHDVGQTLMFSSAAGGAPINIEGQNTMMLFGSFLPAPVPMQ